MKLTFHKCVVNVTPVTNPTPMNKLSKYIVKSQTDHYLKYRFSLIFLCFPTLVENEFHPPLKARRLRLHPTEWNSHNALRAEVIGHPPPLFKFYYQVYHHSFFWGGAGHEIGEREGVYARIFLQLNI